MTRADQLISLFGFSLKIRILVTARQQTLPQTEFQVKIYERDNLFPTGGYIPLATSYTSLSKCRH